MHPLSIYEGSESLETLVKAKVETAHFTHLHTVQWNLSLPVPIWLRLCSQQRPRLKIKYKDIAGKLGKYIQSNIVPEMVVISFAFFSMLICRQATTTKQGLSKSREIEFSLWE